MIDNNGGDGKNDGAGGGSGGSILIKTLMFSGHGSIQVNGGNGRGSGGGGSGGRLAVHISWLREYSGMKAFTLGLLNGIYINYISASCLCFQTNCSLINLERLE